MNTINLNVHSAIVIWHLVGMLIIAYFLPGSLVAALTADLVITVLFGILFAVVSRIRGED